MMLLKKGVVNLESLVAALDLISKDLEKIGIDRICQDGGIFFSFTCDPFDIEADMFILQQVVLHLLFDRIPVTILTKKRKLDADGFVEEYTSRPYNRL